MADKRKATSPVRTRAAVPKPAATASQAVPAKIVRLSKRQREAVARHIADRHDEALRRLAKR